MAVPPRLDEIPDDDEVVAALARLCTRALRTYWILEPEGRVLLGLDCVRAHLSPAQPKEAEERPYAVALREYLEFPVARIESSPYRTILEVVLGLGDERWKKKSWRHEKAKVRRKKAGELFRGPDDADETVEADTIRQHHEPRAIKALAKLVLEDESLARAANAEHAASS